jgi:hypothetical protein
MYYVHISFIKLSISIKAYLQNSSPNPETDKVFIPFFKHLIRRGLFTSPPSWGGPQLFVTIVDSTVSYRLLL